MKTDNRAEEATQRAEGDWRRAIGRLRATGRHDLADAIEIHAAPPRCEDCAPRRTR